MSSPSALHSEADLSSDVEKDTKSIPSGQGSLTPGEIEKEREDRRQLEGFTNTAAVPGVPIDEDESLEEDEPEEPQGHLSAVVSRVLSRSSTKSAGPPPDGGVKAWTAAACGHIVIMNTWGFINSFGVFQTYYASALDRPPSAISWIGSVQVFLLFFIGTFTGRLTDAGYFRQVFTLGCVFQVVGLFTTAQCTQYWQLFLAQGICMGLGNGCLFCPALAIISTYFAKRRSFAIGVAAAGGATGGLVFPSMVRQLLPSVGFPWAVRAIGFIQAATLLVANVFLRPRIPPRKSGPLLDLQAFKELEYTFYACGSYFCFWGVYFAFYYLASFSRDIIGMSYTDSLNLLLVVNGLGILGRLVPNLIADRVGPINMFIPTAAISGICALCWMAVSSTAGLYAWTVFYGIAAGGVQSLFPAGLSSLTTDLRKAGVRLGMVFTINSFATLTGPPIAGAIITACGGRYYGAQAFAGSVLLVGACFLCAARVVKGRKSAAGVLRAKV